jgi:acyl-CoA synthetase (AMP-forming)/AMP-acid ligase II
MNLALLLANSARSFPDRPALSIGRDTLHDYATMGLRAARLAAGLRYVLRLAPGDRVAIAMRNCPQYLELLFAIWHAGLTAAPLNAKLHPRELAFIIEDCDAKAVFAHEDIAHGLATLAPGRVIITPGGNDYEALARNDAAPMHPVQPQDLAWIFYTSGTTGHPKGAMLSHRNLMAMAISYLADIDKLTPQDALLHLAATSHASGLFGLSFIAKAANNILPPSGGYDSAETAGIIDATPKLSFFVPPTLLRRMSADQAMRDSKVDNIRTILVGAAPVYAEDLRAGLAAFGPRIWNGYGQGESPCTITAMDKEMIAAAARSGDDARLVSVGIARTGIELRIAADDGSSVPAGEAGEVLVRGDTVMSGYWNRPAATAETLAGGWLHTGDMGRLDERGFLMLLDRKKDLIISGGVNIYAREVEEALLAHPGVADVAVIGLPDPEWGENVTAVVVGWPGLAIDAATLDAHCLERMARFKRPKQYEFVAGLPRNAAGKVLKRELREKLAPG